MASFASIIGALNSQRLINSLDPHIMVQNSLSSFYNSHQIDAFQKTIGDVRQEVFCKNSVPFVDFYNYLEGTMEYARQKEFFDKNFKGYEFTVYLHEVLLKSGVMDAEDFKIEIPIEGSSMDIGVKLKEPMIFNIYNPISNTKEEKVLEKGEYYLELKSGYLPPKAIEQVKKYKNHLVKNGKYKDGCIKVVTINKEFNDEEKETAKELLKLGVEVIQADIDRYGLHDRARTLKENLNKSLYPFKTQSSNSRILH